MYIQNDLKHNKIVRKYKHKTFISGLGLQFKIFEQIEN